MIKFHSDTVASTAAKDANRLAQRMSWQDAAEKGIVDVDQLMRRRVVVLDGRERPEHHAMSGEVRRFDEPYSNGEVVAGELSWGCRCVDAYFLARKSA